MIKDLSQLKMPTITSALALNILLHVTILFAILSIIFINYISKITSDTINDQIKNIIKETIDKSYDEIYNMKKILLENLNLQNSLIEQFQNTNDVNDKLEIKNKIKDTYNIINELQNKINDEAIPYNYYIDLFSKQNSTRQGINNEIFFYIKFTNILIIIFLIMFLIYLTQTNTITIDQIKIICLENILTFILVGIIELLFFKNIVMKYVPIEPSLLIRSFLQNFK